MYNRGNFNAQYLPGPPNQAQRPPAQPFPGPHPPFPSFSQNHPIPSLPRPTDPTSLPHHYPTPSFPRHADPHAVMQLARPLQPPARLPFNNNRPQLLQEPPNHSLGTNPAYPYHGAGTQFLPAAPPPQHRAYLPPRPPLQQPSLPPAPLQQPSLPPPPLQQPSLPPPPLQQPSFPPNILQPPVAGTHPVPALVSAPPPGPFRPHLVPTMAPNSLFPAGTDLASHSTLPPIPHSPPPPPPMPPSSPPPPPPASPPPISPHVSRVIQSSVQNDTTSSSIYGNEAVCAGNIEKSSAKQKSDQESEQQIGSSELPNVQLSSGIANLDSEHTVASPALSDMDMADDEPACGDSGKIISMPSDCHDSNLESVEAQSGSSANLQPHLTSTGAPNATSTGCTGSSGVFVQGGSPFCFLQEYASDDSGDEKKSQHRLPDNEKNKEADNRNEVADILQPQSPEDNRQKLHDKETNTDLRNDNSVMGGRTSERRNKPADTRDSRQQNLDEFGRIAREDSSDSDSDGMHYSSRNDRSSNSWTRECNQSSYGKRKRRRSRSQERNPRSADVQANTFGKYEGDYPPVCFNFIKGRCSYGASCRYAHSSHEIQKERSSFKKKFGEKRYEPHYSGRKYEHHDKKVHDDSFKEDANDQTVKGHQSKESESLSFHGEERRVPTPVKCIESSPHKDSPTLVVLAEKSSAQHSQPSTSPETLNSGFVDHTADSVCHKELEGPGVSAPNANSSDTLDQVQVMAPESSASAPNIKSSDDNKDAPTATSVALHAHNSVQPLTAKNDLPGISNQPNEKFSSLPPPPPYGNSLTVMPSLPTSGYSQIQFTQNTISAGTDFVQNAVRPYPPHGALPMPGHAASSQYTVEKQNSSQLSIQVGPHSTQQTFGPQSLSGSGYLFQQPQYGQQFPSDGFTSGHRMIHSSGGSHFIPSIDETESSIKHHINPFASTFEKPLSAVCGTSSTSVQPYLTTNYAQEWTRPGLHSHESSGGNQSKITVGSTAGAPYDPLFDSIEPSADDVKTAAMQEQKPPVHVAERKDKEKEQKRSVHVAERKDKENAESENDELGEVATDAEGGGVENVSPGPLDAKEWSPGAPGEIEIDQVKSDKRTRGNDSRSMKLFKVALADFVKEMLKPSWREGNMSKEAFKTIVKKTVEKVSNSMLSHHVPKTQAKINQYIELSQRKLAKLVMGYVDKYVKV